MSSAGPLRRFPTGETKGVFPGKSHLSLMPTACPFPVSEVEKQWMCVRRVSLLDTPSSLPHSLVLKHRLIPGCAGDGTEL